MHVCYYSYKGALTTPVDGFYSFASALPPCSCSVNLLCYKYVANTKCTDIIIEHRKYFCLLKINYFLHDINVSLKYNLCACQKENCGENVALCAQNSGTKIMP